MESITGSMLLDFSELQKKLLSNFLMLYPDAVTSFLLTVPRRGELDVEGNIWKFLKHGAGCRFESTTRGDVVDAHKLYKDIPSPIDAWRVLQYVESTGTPCPRERDVKARLVELERQGFLDRTDYDGVYQLKRPRTKA